jgi:hypothetical protein
MQPNSEMDCTIAFHYVIPPLRVFNDISKVLLVSLIYDTLMLLSPCHVDIAPSPATLTSNKEQNRCIGMSHLSLSAAILAQWWHLVAF